MCAGDNLTSLPTRAEGGLVFKPSPLRILPLKTPRLFSGSGSQSVRSVLPDLPPQGFGCWRISNAHDLLIDAHGICSDWYSRRFTASSGNARFSAWRRAFLHETSSALSVKEFQA